MLRLPGVSVPSAPNVASALSRVVGTVRNHIAGKIIAPYLFLIQLLALLATYLVVRSVSSSLEERFGNSLLDGGHAANEAMVKVEEGRCRRCGWW